MYNKLDKAEDRYEELSRKISDPDVMENQDEYRKLTKEFSDLETVITRYREYKKVQGEIQEAEELLRQESDQEFKQLVESDLAENREHLESIKEVLRVLLLPSDPNDDKSVIVEIRGGAGGDEAALFAGVLFRMYSMYAENRAWRVEILHSNPTGIGGFKEIVFSVEAKGAYSRLKFESGVHRVQRVPTTESSGRIHTSTVTVAVLPEVEDVDVQINPSDLQIDTFRASGAGGQHVNKTDSAIRMTHEPTGIVVTCQDERSQHKNKEKALKILRSKLYEIAREQQDSEVSEQRKNQVGTGDRSERIRTYNYPQGRVTDHRINLTLYKLEAVLNGDLDEIVNALITEEQSQKLSGESME